MNSRDTILAAVKGNQPSVVQLPNTEMYETTIKGSQDKFAAMLKAVGGEVLYVSGYEEIARILLSNQSQSNKIISTVVELKELAGEQITIDTTQHYLHDVDVALLEARFGVAENGAVWLTDKDMVHRVLPYITQHLFILLRADSIVPTMHDAYDKIAQTTYSFGAFIAGPSKTADIEQSLVIGAHGARSLTVIILNIKMQ